MRLDSLAVKGFDLEATLTSGQIFHWERHGDGWIGAIASTGVYLEQSRRDLLRCSAGCGSLVSHYFALDHDWKSIRATFPAHDPHLSAALAIRPGLRILRQPKWECLATFLTSALKQIPQIRILSLRLRARHGHEVPVSGYEASAPRVGVYPTPETLARAGEQALRDCGLGFRARTLWQTARVLTESGTDLEAWSELDDPALSRALMQLPGVGPKIADCVRLFAYGRLSAFPIDVWIARVLKELYGSQKFSTAEELRVFVQQHFGPYGGYAQQFLFEWARAQKPGLVKLPGRGGKTPPPS